MASPVASGMFHRIPDAAALPWRFMYWGAIVSSVSVVTLINAVAPGWVRSMTIPAARVSWAALTVNTFRPASVPVSWSAAEYGLRVTLAPVVWISSAREALSSRSVTNSDSNEKGGTACVTPPDTVKLGATSAVRPYVTPPDTLPPAPVERPAMKSRPAMISGLGSPGAGPTLIPSSVTSPAAAIRPAMLVPLIEVKSPSLNTANPAASPKAAPSPGSSRALVCKAVAACVGHAATRIAATTHPVNLRPGIRVEHMPHHAWRRSARRAARLSAQSSRRLWLPRPDDRGTGVLVYAMRLLDLDLDQARIGEHAFELGARERAGDAAGPRRNVGAGGRVEVVVGDHIGDGNAASGAEDTRGLAHDLGLVGREVDDAVGDDDIDAGVGKREILEVALDELDVLDPRLSGG